MSEKCYINKINDNDVLVRCKYKVLNDGIVSIGECVMNTKIKEFNCIGVACHLPVWVSWTYYLINKKHLIEVNHVL